MAAFNKFQPFAEDAYEGVHNLGSDTLKILLTNVAPAATDGQISQLTEIAAGNGYTAGGTTVTITASGQTGGTYKLEGNDVTFTASGGAIGPFRYAHLYNDTSASDRLIGSWDNGSSETLNDGESITLDFSDANGILQPS